MRQLFWFSYGSLYMLVTLEALLLVELAKRTLVLKQGRRSMHKTNMMLPSGTPVPAFSAPFITTDQSLMSTNLEGHQTMLLFVSPDHVSVDDSDLTFFAHVLWHRSNGNTYVLCCGEQNACREIATRGGFTEHNIPMLWDDGGKIAQQFRIHEYPQAVELDANARVVRYGEMLPTEKDVDVGNRERLGNSHA